MADGPGSDPLREPSRCSATWPVALSSRAHSTGIGSSSAPLSGRQFRCRRGGEHRSNRSRQTRRTGQDRRVHVRDLAGFDGPSPRGSSRSPPVPGHSARSRRIDQLFTELATSLGQPAASSGDDAVDLNADPLMAMMANLSKMMAPSMMGMAVGSMVGRMATQAFGQYRACRFPRQNSGLTVLPANIDRFRQTSSITPDEMRMRYSPNLPAARCSRSRRSAKTTASLVQRHVEYVRPDPEAIAEKPPRSIPTTPIRCRRSSRRSTIRPSSLECMQSPEQPELEPFARRHRRRLIGYVDYIVDGVLGAGSSAERTEIAEAVSATGRPQRRRCLHRRLLGLRLTHHQVQRGKNFSPTSSMSRRGTAERASRPFRRPCRPRPRSTRRVCRGVPAPQFDDDYTTCSAPSRSNWNSTMSEHKQHCHDTDQPNGQEGDAAGNIDPELG